ncbi:MAG: hypothetical protein AAB214_04170, partial [Fibrobacterota bacterium]
KEANDRRTVRSGEELVVMKLLPPTRRGARFRRRYVTWGENRPTRSVETLCNQSCALGEPRRRATPAQHLILRPLASPGGLLLPPIEQVGNKLSACAFTLADRLMPA